jgi:hypothetical protein
VSLAVSGEIVLELDIEDPVHAFDAPVSADGARKSVAWRAAQNKTANSYVIEIAI